MPARAAWISGCRIGVRPTWGIYRSLGDTSGALRDCFPLLDNMRAYQKQ
jgi:hypothetical protein